MEGKEYCSDEVDFSGEMIQIDPEEEQQEKEDKALKTRIDNFVHQTCAMHGLGWQNLPSYGQFEITNPDERTESFGLDQFAEQCRNRIGCYHGYHDVYQSAYDSAYHFNFKYFHESNKPENKALFEELYGRGSEAKELRNLMSGQYYRSNEWKPYKNILTKLYFNLQMYEESVRWDTLSVESKKRIVKDVFYDSYNYPYPPNKIANQILPAIFQRLRL